MSQGAPIIGEIRDEDVDAVTALWVSAGVVRPWNDPVRDIAFARAASQATILVAVIDHRPVATVMVGHDGHRGWVYYLAVCPELQDQGLGRSMMAAAESWLEERGVWKLKLLVRADNSAVRGFYEGLAHLETQSISFQKGLRGSPRADDAN